MVALENSPISEDYTTKTKKSESCSLENNNKKINPEVEENNNDDCNNNETQVSYEKTEQQNIETKDEKPIYKYWIFEFHSPLKWDNLILITAWHIWFIHSVYYALTHEKHPLTVAWIFIVAYTSGVGVTAGAHRLWSHKSYKATFPLRFILTFSYAATGMNSIFNWVRDHRLHHKYSDTKYDPHNASRGFFYSHCGWLMMKKSKDVIEKGKQIDMSDILSDPLIAFQERHFGKLKLFLCFVIPTLVPVIFWNEKLYMAIITQCVIRYLSVINSIWLVNSAAHLYGTKPFDKRILPRQNIFVTTLALGEGWHNYHHVFPWDWRTSEHAHINYTAWVLQIYKKLGWAYDCREPTIDMIRNTFTKYGDGSYSGPIKEISNPYETEKNCKVE